MMDFVVKMMNSVVKMMYFVVKMMNSVVKMMYFVFRMMSSVFIMISLNANSDADGNAILNGG